jgi:hypothetical protein
MSWLRPSLEKLGNVAFIAMCVVVIAVGVQRLLPARAAPGPPPPVEPGTRFSLHPDLRAAESRASVIIALSATCQFCTASMPFYRRLAELDAVREGRARLAIIGLQSDAVIRDYMAANGLEVGTVVHVMVSGVPVQATPMLLVVDAQGAVTRSWAGRLPATEERVVIDEIARLASR